MSFEQQWLEYDFNPFILYSSNGKVISLNSKAQFLLAVVSPSEIFELATNYANVSFGFKTTFMKLKFGNYTFFGFTIGYENEDEIGIKLYQAPSFKLNNPKEQTGQLTNIYTLIDLCISTNSISSNVEFKKEFDPTIPEIVIDSDNFIKVLNKAYLCFIDNEIIYTKLFFRVGEHIKYEDKKYSLFSIEISSKNIDKNKTDDLYKLTKESNFFVDIEDKITINVPMITSK